MKLPEDYDDLLKVLYRQYLLALSYAAIQTLDNDNISLVGSHIRDVVDVERIPSDEKTPSDYQLCHLLRPGISGVLDVARKALQETVQDILEYTKGLSGK